MGALPPRLPHPEEVATIAATNRSATARGGVTLEEVAALAGVSRATASRAINGSARVRHQTREAVQHAVDQLGYVPNWAARSLVTRRTSSLGLVITEPDTRLFADPYFAGVIRGISERLGDSAYQLVILMPRMVGQEAPIEHYLDNGHVDGVIFISLHGDDTLPYHVAARGLPTVVNGRLRGAVRAPSADIGFIDADNRGGARAAASYLLDRGRERIAMITGPVDMHAANDRYDGYVEALSDAGIPVDRSLVERGDFTAEGGRRAMRSLLERRADVDAVFAASDLMAVAALEVLQSHGTRVPDEVAVVGFDDTLPEDAADPALTTVRQPVNQMGRAMTEALLEMIETGESSSRQQIFGTELVVRASA